MGKTPESSFKALQAVRCVDALDHELQSTDSSQATFNAKESIKYGTHIVGGVTPGKTAEHLGLPVLPSVTEVCISAAALDQIGF